MLEDEIEHSVKQTNARMYWDDLLAVRGTIHVHFVAPNPIGIETKVATNDDKSTVHLLTDSSIIPQSLIPNPKSCYQIGDYVVVKYSYFLGEIIAVLDESAQVKVMIQSGPQYWKWPDRDDVLLYKWCNVIKKIDPLVIVSNRGTFRIEEMEYI